MLADPELEAITLLDTKAMADHQKAGLCMLCSTPSWIGVVQVGDVGTSSLTPGRER